MLDTTKVPVTLLTGYLGAGKTTLLNRILTTNHGKRFAVIVNEFGEIGIDNDLVIGANEEIFEMNNGCICCTVRGDLIRIISGLLKRAEGFDGVLIETTGLADPAPVIQTFFVDDDLRDRVALEFGRDHGRRAPFSRPGRQRARSRGADRLRRRHRRQQDRSGRRGETLRRSKPKSARSTNSRAFSMR